MDTRTTSADFYPGGKTPVTAGGGITSGEAGGAAGEPMVPVTKVEQLPEHYRESDMRSKINELARVISGGVAAIVAMVSLTLGAEPVKVLGVKKDALWNDDFVVTNVVADFAGFATTNTVTGATNALAATFVRGLEVATNTVLQAGAKEIAAATNALSQSVDARLRASTNGSFSATSLEPYAKRTWVEAQGYLKSTNMTGYAQIEWVKNQGFVKREEAAGEISRIVNEKIAAQDKTDAYRLMAPGGEMWIDGTGICWEVSSHVEVEGEVLYSKGIVQEWSKEVVEDGIEYSVSSFIGENGLPGWDYIKKLRWPEDPSNQDPDALWQEVEYNYVGYTDPTVGTTVLELQGEYNSPDQNGTYPPESIYLKYWLETNAVTRIATTNDVSSNASSDVSKEADLLAFYYPDGNVTSMDQITTNGIEYAVGDDGGAYVVKGVELSGHVVLPWKVEIGGKDYKVTAIGKSAFEGVYYANSFTIFTAPITVNNIGMYAFSDCGSIRSISFPSVTSIGEGAFFYCGSLTSVYLPSATSIGDYAFESCDWITSVSFPSVTSIGENAFYYCDSLTIVNIPYATSIGNSAFESCGSLITVNLPYVTSIGNYAFAYCTLTSVNFGSSPKPTVPSLGEYAFDEVPNTCKFIIPLGMYDEWIAAPGWSDLYASGYKFEGYASTEQLKRLPTHETVTNVARAVSNSFWDEKNEVLWRMEFRDGEPMFVPVTNENVKATGGVL